jgi:hypothetical protein
MIIFLNGLSELDLFNALNKLFPKLSVFNRAGLTIVQSFELLVLGTLLEMIVDNILEPRVLDLGHERPLQFDLVLQI